MKKHLAFLLILLIAVSLCACETGNNTLSQIGNSNFNSEVSENKELISESKVLYDANKDIVFN